MTETFIEHCIKFYEALDAVSIDVLSDGKTIRRFAGKVSEVYKTTGIAQTYYSPIMKTLQKHGAMTLVQRGGRNADTVYVLQGLPEVWDVDGWRNQTTKDKGLTVTKKYDRLAKDVQDIKQSLGGINVLMALEEVEKKLQLINVRLALLEPKTKTKQS